MIIIVSHEAYVKWRCGVAHGGKKMVLKSVRYGLGSNAQCKCAPHFITDLQAV